MARILLLGCRIKTYIEQSLYIHFVFYPIWVASDNFYYKRIRWRWWWWIPYLQRQAA